MTHWQFNLRSGFDIDDDDNELTTTSEPTINIPPSNATTDLRQNDTHDNSPSHILIPTTTTITTEDSTSKELEQLFGSTDEETVQYKPNPWSIAKINANARATRDPASSKLQNPKVWNPSGRKVIPGFTHPARPPNPFFQTRAKDSRTWLPQPKAPKNSLRDAISAALRRDSAATVVSATAPHDTGIIPDTHPPDHSGPEHTDSLLILPEKALHEGRDEPPRTLSPHEANRAYILQNNTVIPQISDNDFLQAQNPRAHFSDPDGYEGDTPVLTWDNQSSDDRPLSPIMENYPPAGFQETSPVSTPRQKPSHGYAVSPSGYVDQLSPDLRPQPVFARPESFDLGDEPGPSRYRRPSPIDISTGPRAMLEPSPMPPLMIESRSETRYPDGRQASERYGQDVDCDRASPIFAYTVPSPISETPRFSSLRESSPARKQTRTHEPDPKAEPSIPARHREPITPLQPTRKHTTPWLDPDEEPVWSTLPSRTKKKTPTRTSPVTTARFRLPGAFLGSSSPAGEQESKRFYKPPPRKRPLERDDEGARWKVTRIG
ncbi:hypothetical protein FRC09_001872 [Ceratobasidium sp. 395]|nr:hypothetical protein FRC09_001872 [Ceratobasidium sp. 395]